MEKILVSKQDIIAGLRNNLQLKDGDLIAVHSSLKSLGQVEGGPVALIEALIAAVGGTDKGTVLMPCFTEPLDVLDLRTAPCRLGLVPETFRQYPGVIRSVNHTHSVAVIGKDARALADTHVGRTPLGKDSPFHELAKRGGYIIHIGCTMCTSSIIHLAEALAPLPYLRIPYPGWDKDIKLIVDDKTSCICPPVENPGCSSSFIKVEEEMERRGLLRRGRVGQADSLRAGAQDTLAVALELIKSDPAVLLCDRPGCPICPRRREALNARGLK